MHPLFFHAKMPMIIARFLRQTATGSWPQKQNGTADSDTTRQRPVRLLAAMASADGLWMHHLRLLPQPRAATVCDRPKTIMWETEEHVVEQTFDAHAGESVLVNAQPAGRQEMAPSVRQSAAAASLTWHAPVGTAPPAVRMSSPADCAPPLLERLESSQTVIEVNVLQRQRLRRVTEEAVVEEAMVDNAGTAPAPTAGSADHLDTPSPKNIIAVLGEQSATRWLTSQLQSEWKWLNGTNEVGKDHDIECQLKAPNPGRRHAEDTAKLHRAKQVAWIIWLLFIVCITYIANTHVYMLIRYGCVTYYCLPL